MRPGEINVGCSEDYCAVLHVTSRDLFTWLPTVCTFSLDPSSNWKSFYGLDWRLLCSLQREVTWSIYIVTYCLDFQFRSFFKMEGFRCEVRGRTFFRNVDDIQSDNMSSYPMIQHSWECLDHLSGACLFRAFYRTWHHVCRSLVPGVSWECSVSIFKIWNWTFGIAH